MGGSFCSIMVVSAGPATFGFNVIEAFDKGMMHLMKHLYYT